MTFDIRIFKNENSKIITADMVISQNQHVLSGPPSRAHERVKGSLEAGIVGKEGPRERPADSLHLGPALHTGSERARRRSIRVVTDFLAAGGPRGSGGGGSGRGVQCRQ